MPIGLVSRVFASGLGDLGSISGRVIPKTQQMVLDAALLNTSKVEQSRDRSCALLNLAVVAYEKGAFGSPLTTVANFHNIYIDYDINFFEGAMKTQMENS